MNASRWSGWRIVALAAVVLGVGMSAVIGFTDGDVETTRAQIRFTARVSVTLFLLAFTASAAFRLWPTAFTRWQRQNRRYLGLAFALSHFVHLGAILTLGLIAPAALGALTNPKAWILGGFAYVLIAAMAATSFDRTARAIGPKAWAILHTFGVYYLWLVFANSFVSRAVTMPEYIVPAVAVLGAMGLRIAAYVQRRRAAGATVAAGPA